jgi:hypothetical protein
MGDFRNKIIVGILIEATVSFILILAKSAPMEKIFWFISLNALLGLLLFVYSYSVDKKNLKKNISDLQKQFDKKISDLQKQLDRKADKPKPIGNSQDLAS